MYNLILTLCVYFFMTVSAAVLLTIIIFKQEQWVKETVLLQFKNYPVPIFHKDLEAEYRTQMLLPVSLEAYSVFSSYSEVEFTN